MIRTRMAPSPTGEYHIGHIRTLLYNYVYARQNKGQFVIRIEDTDRKRFVAGAQERILQVIKDYGFSWDEGPDIGGPYAPYVQTERLAIYEDYIKKLIAIGGAYYCFCTENRLEEMRTLQKAAGHIPKYDKHCLNLSPEEIETNLKNKVPYVVRLKIPPNETIKINDIVRGEIIFNTNDVDDQILVKSNGIPTYHFAAGIDDHFMNITHVLRGDEWISSLPKQYTIYKCLGWDLPQFAHLTVFLDPAGGKMSKRHGSVSARSFLDDGYLPDALLNFLMLLGWNPGTDRELFTLDEFINEFSLAKLHTKQPVFDRKKLDYFNGLYIRQKSDADLFPYFKKFLPQASDDQITALTPVLKDRLVKFGDLPIQTKFLFEDVDYPTDLLLQRGADRGLVVDILSKTKDLLFGLETFNFITLQTKLMDLISSNGWNVGQFFMVLRVAICGAPQTPPLVECLPILGKENTLRKIDLALAKLK
jgi:glutamyl-tRNA synthetase